MHGVCVGLPARGGVADEASLIARIAAGDSVALRGLFARHHARVYRFILRLVRDAAVAEELTNEVFLEVWRNAGSFARTASPVTWMLSIAHHRAIGSLRRRREESWDERAASALTDAADDPEVAAQKVDKGAILRRCLDALSPEHKGIVDLVYYHEMSISEAAEVLQIPENTVKTRLFHARKRLSQLLEQAGIDRGWP
jgi:RNA polymerase sigma-70 factor, ECF subfamily